MSISDAMSDLTGIDHSRVSCIAERLVAHRETIAISESSAGALISAALLSVPGASAYFLGGGVIYTRKAMGALLELTPAKLEGVTFRHRANGLPLASRNVLAPLGSTRRPKPFNSLSDRM
jgi:nicotinamide-nucleotide amidase